MKNSVVPRIPIFSAVMFLFMYCASAAGNSGHPDSLKVNASFVSVVTERGYLDYFFWSPDGEKFICAVDLPTNWGCEREILLTQPEKMGSGGKMARKLNKEGPLPCGFQEEWFYDRKRILIGNYGGVLRKTYSLDLETGEKKEISVPKNWIVFNEHCSPTSNTLVCNAIYFDSSKWTGSEPESRKYDVDFYHPWQIALIDLDRNEFKLVPTDTAEQGEPLMPTWSSDGKSIAYCAARDGTAPLAYRISESSCYDLDLGTGKTTKVIYYEGGKDTKDREFRHLSGNQAIEILGEYSKTENRYYGAWAYKTDGSGEMHRISDGLPGEMPNYDYREYFSPDLKYVADLYVKDSKTYLRIRELKTGKQKLLDAYLQPNDKFPIAWSPDSKKICYLRQDKVPFKGDAKATFLQIMTATIEE